MNTMKYWNKHASSYDELWRGKNSVISKSAEEIVKILKIKNGESCLDLCCGTGILTKNLGGQVGNGGFVLGVDNARNMLEIAKNKIFANTELVNCSVEHFELRKKFDVITCQFGLQFCDPHKIFAKMKQSMKKSTSRIGIVVHGQHSTGRSIFNATARKVLDDLRFGLLNPYLERFNTPLKLKQHITQNGLETVSVTECYFSRHYSSFDEFVSSYMNYFKDINDTKFNELSSLRLQLESELRKKIQKFKIKDGFGFPHQVIFGVAKIPKHEPNTHSNYPSQRHQMEITEYI